MADCGLGCLAIREVRIPRTIIILTMARRIIIMMAVVDTRADLAADTTGDLMAVDMAVVDIINKRKTKLPL
jgi:hypothetical protein